MHSLIIHFFSTSSYSSTLYFFISLLSPFNQFILLHHKLDRSQVLVGGIFFIHSDTIFFSAPFRFQ